MDTIAVATAYRTAAEDLRENGWIQGDWSDKDGKCVAQALFNALGIPRTQWLPVAVSRPLDAELSKLKHYRVIKKQQAEGAEDSYWPECTVLEHSIIGWNDSVFATRRQITRLLDRVADRLEADQKLDAELQHMIAATPERELVPVG